MLEGFRGDTDANKKSEGLSAHRENVPLSERPFDSASVVELPAEKESGKETLVLNSSWGVGTDVYEHVLRAFNGAEKDRRTICIDHPRWAGTTDVPPEEKELVKEYPPEEIRRALTLIKVLEAKNAGETAVVGHSEGAASSAIAALLLAKRAAEGRPGPRIRNLVLYAPVGFIGEDTLPHMAKGFAAQPAITGKRAESFGALPVSEEERAAAASEGRTIANYDAIPETPEDKEGGSKHPKQFPMYLATNPYRATKEVLGMANIQLIPLIRTLREQYGIGVLVWSAVDDTVFETSKMAGTMDEAETKKPKEDRIIIPGTLRPGDVDGFYTVRGDHSIPFPYASIIEGQLTTFEKNRQSRSTATSGTSGG